VKFMQQFAGPGLGNLPPTAQPLAAPPSNTSPQQIANRHPIILVPPLAGVQLERRLDHK
jgi:hypothetical protein